MTKMPPLTEPPAAPNPVRQGLGQLLWSWIDMFGAKVVTLGTFLVLATLLSPKEFGVAALATSFIGVIVATMDASFGSCLMQRQDVDRSYFDTSFVLVVVTAAVLSILFVGLGAGMAWVFGSADYLPVFAAFAPAILLHGLTVVHQAYLVREHKLAVVARARILAVLVSAGATLGMALYHPSVWVFVVQQISNIGVFAILILAGAHLRLRFGFRRSHAADIIAFSRYFWAWGGVSTLEKNIDIWIITGYLGPVATGLYSSALRLTLMAYEITTGPVVRLALPIYARHQNSPASLRERYLALSSASALVMFPAFAGLALSGPTLVPLMLGREWTVTGEILPLMAVATWLFASNMYEFQLLTALNRPDKVLYLNMAALALLVVTLAAGVPFGLVGIAAALVLRNLVMKGLLLRQAQGVLGIGIGDYLRSLRMASLCTAAMTVGFLVPGWTGGVADGWTGLLTQIACAALFYMLCATLLYRRAYADVQRAFTTEAFGK